MVWERLLPLVMDGLVLAMLAASIGFSIRLSTHLKTFRDSRREIEKMIVDLSTQIKVAEGAIMGLKDVTRKAGLDLQDLIDDAQRYRDELQLMNDSGNRLATRLERLASQNGAEAQREEEAVPAKKAAPLTASSVNGGGNRKTAGRGAETAGFSIRDQEVERGETGEEAALWGDDDDAADGPFYSQAEKDLYKALQKNKNGQMKNSQAKNGQTGRRG